MPDNIPIGLKPFLFHGVDIDWEGRTEAIADCPFCVKDRKFYIDPNKGLWDCKVCGKNGNASGFLKHLWDASIYPNIEEAQKLAANRSLLKSDTLYEWGLKKSLINGDWILPAYNSNGKLVQLYKYKRDAKGKWVLMATAGLNHGLLAPLDKIKPNMTQSIVYITEGPWDGMVLYELFKGLKRADINSDLIPTSSIEYSLLAESAIVAVPGCNAFSKFWAPVFSNKTVALLYDNDYPIYLPNAPDKPIAPASWTGMKRAVNVLSSIEEPPSIIKYLKWAEDDSDHNPQLAKGYDIRDDLAAPSYQSIQERAAALGHLLNKIVPVPADWIPGRSSIKSRQGSTEIECLPCDSWKTLNNAWLKALKWTPGLARALAVMLSSVTSTRAVGDPLWVKIISPPATAKSTLCEALSVNRSHIIAKSTIRGFHSGYKSDKGGTEDNSLVARLYDKTLVTKDGDTLLSSPNLTQILSEARDLYDGASRTYYRNKMSKDYNNVRMTWILCGTSSLRQLDSSELGERFLDCVIMENIDTELENEILFKVANRAERNMNHECNGEASNQYDPDLVTAMQLTGGYVNYLRDNAQDLLSATLMPSSALDQCIKLAKFVAYMRARPSKKQDEVAERELASRLVSQLVRLAKCLAVVLNTKTVDDIVMNMVRLVALDTARGRTLELIKHLHKSTRAIGLAMYAISTLTGNTEDADRKLLEFLRKIKAVEVFSIGLVGTVRVRYRLTEQMEILFNDVIESKNAAN